MALYALGDLHLSLNSNKSMEIFGDGWQDYVLRLKEAFSALRPEDVTVLCGDLSWGMSLEESLEDFRFIDALPGKKYLLKGNHDYWWNTAAKMERFFREHELTTMEILHNNCKFYGELALCGTRGWFYELDNQGTHNEKVLLRESARRFPPPGHRGNVGWNGVFAGVGGLSEICSQKNLRMMQKRCGN